MKVCSCSRRAHGRCPLLYVLDNIVVCARGCPVTVTSAGIYGLYHGTWIENRRLASDLITIVPSFHFFDIHSVLIAQRIYLSFGEPEETVKFSRLHHRIFYKVVECRLGFVFLNGQDAGHVCSRENGGCAFVLEHPSQQVYVFILCVVISGEGSSRNVFTLLYLCGLNKA